MTCAGTAAASICSRGMSMRAYPLPSANVAVSRHGGYDAFNGSASPAQRSTPPSELLCQSCLNILALSRSCFTLFARSRDTRQ